MQILALIPARGGSKGIPHKNIRLVAGKPLVAWTIEAARNARHPLRVVVSTDSPEIREVARAFGAEVIDRPAEISGDHVSSEIALLHALDFLSAAEGYRPDLVVFLQCTSPLTLPEDIDGTIDTLLREEADSALAVTRFHGFLWRMDESGDAVGINHDKRIRLRRQDREEQFLETGAVYAMRTAGFLKAKHRFFGRTACYVMPASRVLEIDEPDDLERADVLLRQRGARSVVSFAAHVEGLALDFDGVFTDNRVYVSGDGTELVVCHRGDGLGLAELRARGVPIVVISSESNPVVRVRTQKLGLECIQVSGDKAEALRRWAAENHRNLNNVVYIGNDINDIPCLKLAGFPVVPADAHPAVKPYARFVLRQSGGWGAIREMCDLIILGLENPSWEGRR